MHRLGRKWVEVEKELIEKKAEFNSKIVYPANKANPYGDLRVARIKRRDNSIEFILMHERFSID